MARAKNRAAHKQKKKDGARKKGEGARRKGGEDANEGEVPKLHVPRKYRKRKTYGSGNKQVAWEEFDHPERLTRTEFGRCIMYSVAEGVEAVTITITHNDAPAQVWRIQDKGEGPGITSGVHICYDSEGRPTSIYIL